MSASTEGILLPTLRSSLGSPLGDLFQFRFHLGFVDADVAGELVLFNPNTLVGPIKSQVAQFVPLARDEVLI